MSPQVLLIGNHDLVVEESKLTAQHRFEFANFQEPKPKKLPEAAVREVLSDDAFRHLSDLLGFTEDKSPDVAKAQRLLSKQGFLRATGRSRSPTRSTGS